MSSIASMHPVQLTSTLLGLCSIKIMTERREEPTILRASRKRPTLTIACDSPP